ncbi:hypothetical protein [Massilia sp. TWP1-3-3]|uniref:hypothetical protein n=1 Tax=Massilia sp. TWP1-3-3 TaxID=2804573 RepID=UPI003CE68C5F
MIVMTLLAAAIDILDLPADQPLLEHGMTENFVRQLQVILLGTRQWREKGRQRLGLGAPARKAEGRIPPSVSTAHGGMRPTGFSALRGRE